jgi:hypothetical protein
MEIRVDMTKRWLVIFALVGLFTPINASAPGGSGQSQPELRVTIHEVCKASWINDYKEISEHDNLSATFEERNVYRITRYDAGDGRADLELVSHEANVSPEGGGFFKNSVVSESWTYQVDQYSLSLLQSHPMTGVDVSFTQGWLWVGVPNPPCSFVKASSPRGMLGRSAHDDSGTSGFPEPTPFQRQLHCTFKPNSTSIAVQGHASFRDTAVPGRVISREVDYSVSGGDTELPEAEIIPPDNYNTWVPEAGKDESTPGNVIVATVKLHKRGDPKKSAGKKAKFRFALSYVSHERGVCLNWPPYAQAKTTPDLKIDQKANLTLDVAGDGQSATTRNSGESATVTITSYDWGAYGHLTATAILDNNEGEITARVQGGEKYDFTIPKDDNGNHIADFWEKTHAGGNAEADDDEQPPGNGDNGDGLSLYEEYRGFHVQGGHIWTNPKLKDIFIYDSTGLGVDYFARSGLTIHLVNANEFAQEGGAPNPRVINPNRGYGTRGPQHVLGLTLGTLDGDYGFDDPSPGPPKSSVNVIIDEQRCLERGVQELDTTIAHELAHACNVVHHGEGDYDTQFYRWLKKDGTWGPWQDDGCCWKVAAPGQEESGMQECIMRYDQANFYERALGSVQWKKGNALVRGEPYGDPEAPGTEFCDDPKGTGVNAAGRPGGPKAGNASVGKCKEQFLVNDTKH